VDRGCRGSRELLVQDALGERREVPRAAPREVERRASVDQPGHDRITTGYLCRCAGKGDHCRNLPFLEYRREPMLANFGSAATVAQW
jgi:hypothetical protein